MQQLAKTEAAFQFQKAPFNALLTPPIQGDLIGRNFAQFRPISPNVKLCSLWTVFKKLYGQSKILGYFFPNYIPIIQ
jgi:hypothetical protein